MHRFYLENIKFNDDGLIIITDKNVNHQLKSVLRVKKGEELAVFDDSGTEYVISVKDFKNEFLGEILKKEYPVREADKKIYLCFSFIKPKNIELILEKSTEIGAAGFMPLITERSVKKDISKNQKERWQKILKEAVEQCGGVKTPELNEAMDFFKFLELSKKFKGEKIIFDKEGGKFGLIDKNFKEYYLLTGPEGGFSENEKNMAKNFGWKSVSFGKRTLRAETAAIVFSALVLNL